MSKYFLIHDLVRKREIFEQACAEDVQCSVIDTISNPTLPNDLTHLGLVYDNTGKKAPFLIFNEQELIQYNEYLESMNSDEPKPFVQSDFLYNSSKFFSPSFMTLITEYKTNNPSFEYLDLITCNVSEELIKSQADELLELGIIVRYSTNFTGKDGDWILESHNINVTDIYFNTFVKSYPYKLGSSRAAVPPQISTAQELHDLMLATDPLELAGNYTLENDIIMDETFECQSIGKAFLVFNGTFDGQGNNVYIKTIVFTDYTGFFGIISGATISNCNIIFGDNLSLNSPSSNGSVGGLVGYIVSDSTVSNCNVIFGNNTTFETTQDQTKIGGLIGWQIGGIINNCNVIFGNQTTFNNQGSTNNYVGGLIGYAQSGGSITRCNVIFGNDTELIVFGFNGVVGGLIGTRTSTPVTNCTGVFKDYRIDGTTEDRVIGSGIVTTSYTLTFGVPTEPGVTDMIGYDNIPQNLEDVRGVLEGTEGDPNTFSQWLISLIGIRQQLTPGGNPNATSEDISNYLNEIIGTDPLSPDVSIGYKNAALQLSMAYSTPPFTSIPCTVETVVSSLPVISSISTTTSIEYLNTPTDNIYTALQKNKYYYVPVSDGKLEVGSVSVDFLTDKTAGTITYDTTTTTIGANNTYTKDGVVFKTYGVGSGLIGIEEAPPTPPVPPTPSTTTEPISWWWVLIVLVVLFIVIGLYIYFFKYDHWFDSSPFSKEL